MCPQNEKLSINCLPRSLVSLSLCPSKMNCRKDIYNCWATKPAVFWLRFNETSFLSATDAVFAAVAGTFVDSSTVLHLKWYKTDYQVAVECVPPRLINL